MTRKLAIIAPNAGIGGVERASSNLANSFARKGYEVLFVALIPEESFYPLDDEVAYIEPKGKNILKMDIAFTVSYIRKQLVTFKPDAVLGFTKFYAALANIALIGTSYRFFVTERSSPLYRWPAHVNWFSKLAFLMRRVHGVVSQTSLASSHHQEYYGKTNYAVIPNALKEVQLYPTIQREKMILAVGRFGDPCKGFDQLIQAFNLLVNNEWTLVFAGGSAEEGKELIDLVKPELLHRIVFLGSVRKIDRVYAQGGIFVIPSRSEGFPNALCEAMAAGCPCISFDFTAGPRDIITPGKDGLIVPDGNIPALAEAIDYLIENPSIRQALGQEALAIADRLQANKIAQMYLDFMFGKEETEVDKQS